MTAVSTISSTDCPVSPSLLSSQDTQSHEKAPASHGAQGETLTISLALGANAVGKERAKGKI